MSGLISSKPLSGERGPVKTALFLALCSIGPEQQAAHSSMRFGFHFCLLLEDELTRIQVILRV